MTEGEFKQINMKWGFDKSLNLISSKEILAQFSLVNQKKYKKKKSGEICLQLQEAYETNEMP